MEHIGYHYRVIKKRTTHGDEFVNVGIWLYGDGFSEVAWGHGWDRAAAVSLPRYRTAAEIEELAPHFALTLHDVPPDQRDEWGEGPYARFDLREPYPGILAPNESPAKQAAELVRHFVATDEPVKTEWPTSPDPYRSTWGHMTFLVEVPNQTWHRMNDHAATLGLFPCDWVKQLIERALDASPLATDAAGAGEEGGSR